MHKTSAWPLLWVYLALIVFASLFPFQGWRAQGIAPEVFLLADFPPPYWTGFDVAINVAGYAPLGFLWALALLRAGWDRHVVLQVVVAGTALSLLMEFLQIYLPHRVPSNLDLLLNASGTLGGALLASLLERLGAIDRWSRFRARWFLPEVHGGLVLLALWPWALLFPAAHPLGLGQGLERWWGALIEALEGTPFLAWVPEYAQIAPVWLPLSPAAEVACVALGLWVPCLLGYGLVLHTGHRLMLALLTAVVGVGVTALSAALSYGPIHAWDWLNLPVRAGLWLGLMLAMLVLLLPRRFCMGLLVCVLLAHLGLLNNASAGAYFAQTLQIWEQGRFIRFFGIGQWLGWLWPYVALAYVLLRVVRPEPEPESQLQWVFQSVSKIRTTMTDTNTPPTLPTPPISSAVPAPAAPVAPVAPVASGYFARHIFFCLNERPDGQPCCAEHGVQAAFEHCKVQVKNLGLSGPGQVRVNKAGCLDRCAAGPVAVVYPEGVWYTYVDESDIDEIVTSHLQNGQIVERLLVAPDVGH